MTPVETIAVTLASIRGTIALLESLGIIPPDQLYRYRGKIADYIDRKTEDLGPLLEIQQELAVLCQTNAERVLAEKSREKNPAFQKPAVSAIALLIGLGALALGFTACAPNGAVIELPETDTMRAGYAVVWPEDASQNPDHFLTTLEDGRMVTTVPKAD